MSELRQMMGRAAQAGRVDWIGLRPGRRADVVAVDAVRVTEAGLEGDRARAGKRAVSLVQAEHLAAIGGYLGRGPVAAADLRRNLVVSGLNLLAYRDREIGIGAEVVLRLRGPCAPCSRMEETFGHGGYAAVRGHGGMVAEVVRTGTIRRGDAVVLRPAP
ncbi:MOSC domain-containing protein [Dinoroseobacter sp. PD6]|uniref:MOSC domain-containing protein n=1 Tax=Dinoroseobacter sp. PD6 TaxID=3028384 RepID=UPI00237A7653|nr:MOSC domain-containing protein [Dinoroseobacter sp. PD6]MDD9716551.1 MOSC domain-containing protein [Dinoroseobacter sp. PD6]